MVGRRRSLTLPLFKADNMIEHIPLHLRRSVSIRPVSATGWHQMAGDRRFTHRSAEVSHLYITRAVGRDAHGTIDFRHRRDLVACGFDLPSRHPAWATEPGRIWRDADAATAGLSTDAIRCWHIVVTLPKHSDAEAWFDMVRAYARDTIAAHGPAVAWAIHARGGGSGEVIIPPHAHLLMTTRGWRHDASHGKTIPSWCGPSMRARLHADWLARLPAFMRAASATPYRAGEYRPAHPDCSAIAHLFEEKLEGPASSAESTRSSKMAADPTKKIKPN
jgi:hypothetical protein